MTLLDGLMTVDWFFGLDLKTASFIIAALGVIHPMFYTCIFFIPMTYLLLTIWVLVVFYSGLSLLLFYGLLTNDEDICRIWIWYALIFVILMVALMYLHFIAVICRKRCNQMTVTLLGILWYMTTIYFILVVNSYRKTLPVRATYTLAMASKENYNVNHSASETRRESSWVAPLNNIENETLIALKNIIDVTDTTVGRCKTNLTNLMGLLREKQIDAKNLLEQAHLHLRTETKKLIDILFPPDKLNETKRLINMSIISDIENETQNFDLPGNQNTTESHGNSPTTVKTSPPQLEVDKTESSLLEMTVLYIEHSPDEEKDMSSRLLLQDEEKKKREAKKDD